jgi:hypothetical protein
MLTPATAQGPRLTKKNGLEEPIEKGHIDLTTVYSDGKWEIFLQLDEDKLLPLEDPVNGVPSLAPGDNVMVAADHEFPNGSRIERAEGVEWDFLGVGSTKGAELTRSVHDQVMTVLPFDYPDRGVKHANYTVLTHTRMPAVLVELGFLTNGADAAWLAQDKNLEAIAQALLLGCNVEVEKPDPKPAPSPPDGVIASTEVLVVESREIKDVIRSLNDSIEMLDNIIKG